MVNKKIILVGKAASGKDYFRDYLIKQGFEVSISHTTRPMRDGEVDGETYHFIRGYEFCNLIDNGFMFEHKYFNGWFFGTSNYEKEKGEVFIFTPSGIMDLPFEFKRNSVIVYFDIPELTRRERLEKRSDSDSIDRRIAADDIDFKDFKDYTIKLHDSNYDCDYLLKTIRKYDNY